jgi:hypothetical protein
MDTVPLALGIHIGIPVQGRSWQSDRVYVTRRWPEAEMGKCEVIFERALSNLFSLYRPLAHIWRIYDASYLPPKIVAHQEMGKTEVFEAGIFENIIQEMRK